MKDQPNERQIRQLRNSIERLNRTVAECAATIRSLSAALEKIAPPVDESETETLPPEQSDGEKIIVQTVHGVRDTVHLPRRKP